MSSWQVHRCRACAALYWDDIAVLKKECFSCHQSDRISLEVPLSSIRPAAHDSLRPLDQEMARSSSSSSSSSSLSASSKRRSLAPKKHGSVMVLKSSSLFATKSVVDLSENTDDMKNAAGVDDLCYDGDESLDPHDAVSFVLTQQHNSQRCNDEDNDDDDANSTGNNTKQRQARESDAFFCVLCDYDLTNKSLSARTVHLKKCARDSNVSTKQLLQMLAPPELLEDTRFHQYQRNNQHNNNESDDEDHAGIDSEVVNEEAEENRNHDDDDGDDPVIIIEPKSNHNTEKRRLEKEQVDAHNFGDSSVSNRSSMSDKPPVVVNALSLMMSAAKKQKRIEAPTPSSISTPVYHAAAIPVSTIPIPAATNNNATLTNAMTASVKPASANRKYSNWKSSKRNSTGPAYAPGYKKIQISSMKIPIIVDGFQYSRKELSDCYFLTHFHSDHYMGLDHSFDAGLVYCSPTTAALVHLRLRVPTSRLISLELDKMHTINVGGEDVQVQLADANHCPGAVCILFLFKTGKKVLHVGDFRWNREVMLLSPLFQSLVYVDPGVSMEGMFNDNKHLTIYLDTTYCNPSYDFPLQNSAIRAVLDVMNKEIVQPNTLYVFGAYGIGKERVYMAVAETFSLQVHVDKHRYQTMMCYEHWTEEMKERLTVDPSASNIWVVGMNEVNFHSFDKLLAQRKDCKRVVAFQPTGWTHRPNASKQQGLTPRSNRQGHKIYSVPYSEHSSYSELIDCIEILRPHIIIPTVNTSENKVKQQLQQLREGSRLLHRKSIFG